MMGEREESSGSQVSNGFGPRGVVKGEEKLDRKDDQRTLEGDLPPSRPEELPHLSTLASLAIIVFLSVLYVIWGLTAYYTIGMKGPPPWYFGAVQDLPASSEYSTETGSRFLNSGQPQRLMTPLPQPQHVMKRPEGRAAPGE
jgi:hypothetical protein